MSIKKKNEVADNLSLKNCISLSPVKNEDRNSVKFPKIMESQASEENSMSSNQKRVN